MNLQVSICSDAQTVAGATEMIGHGGDEANLTFEGRNFKYLGGDKAQC